MVTGQTYYLVTLQNCIQRVCATRQLGGKIDQTSSLDRSCLFIHAYLLSAFSSFATSVCQQWNYILWIRPLFRYSIYKADWNWSRLHNSGQFCCKKGLANPTQHTYINNYLTPIKHSIDHYTSWYHQIQIPFQVMEDYTWLTSSL